jgi:murein DD-endopeptidase MepM/ murein hydrolase activator NlpD
VAAGLDRVASAQVAYVDGFASSLAKRNDSIAGVLKIVARSAPPAPAHADVGGPYVPLAAISDPAAFQSEIDLVKGEISRYAALRKLAAQLPLTVPVPDPVVNSPFGERIDPFLGTPAIHPGIDYRAAEGQPIGATAPGTVTAAAYGDNGGYGNMVDIDHGNGVVTRFGHLSAIDVRVGLTVAKGTIIGKAGETGRATGPHLHYEVRVNDQPVDPNTFIAAGDKLAALF